VRRTVATLLIVASPLVLATPVSGAADARLPSSGSFSPALAPAVPAVTDATPTVAPVAAAPALAPPAVMPLTAPKLKAPVTPAPVRHAVKPARTRARAAAAGLGDSAYTARLQAELCAARQIFCGLASNGRYPTR